MKLKATLIDHINMEVKDLDETVTFYDTVFGFTVLKDQTNDQYTSKIIGNEHIKLCLYENKNLDGHSGINHFGFYVENFDAIVKHCEQLGVEMPYGVVDWGESRSVYIKDPSGYEIELSDTEGGAL